MTPSSPKDKAEETNMAKTKSNAGQGQRFKKPALPKMPDGYYSGDKPNPNLRKFVDEHLKENPYDPATDDHDVPAFDKPIESTTATSTGTSPTTPASSRAARRPRPSCSST